MILIFHERGELMSAADIQALLKQDPQEILMYIQGTMAKPSHKHSLFDWLGLADCASTLSHASDKREASLLWARIAVACYDHIVASSTSPTGLSRVSPECSAMMMRVWCIATFGPQENDTLCDPMLIVHWFLANTTLSLDEAIRRSEQWRELPTDQIIEVRSIKNRLAVIKALDNIHRIPTTSLPEIKPWLANQDKLV
jgi:hypothetical protein